MADQACCQLRLLRRLVSDQGLVSTFFNCLAAQVNLLKKNFRGGLGEMAKDIDINTIDGFQVCNLLPVE